MRADQVVIPTWIDCASKMDAGRELTAVDAMVLRYQPNIAEGRDQWRLALAHVIAEAAGGMRPK